MNKKLSAVLLVAVMVSLSVRVHKADAFSFSNLFHSVFGGAINQSQTQGAAAVMSTAAVNGSSCNPSITVTSPAQIMTGVVTATYTPGQTVPIAWTSCNPKKLPIIVYAYRVTNGAIGTSSAPEQDQLFAKSTQTDDGSESVTINSFARAGLYKVVFGLYSSSSDLAPMYITGAQNTMYFTVAKASTPTPTLTVLSPNGGEAYKGGQSVNVAWKSTGIPSTNKKVALTIEIYSNGKLQSHYPIPGLYTNDGSETISLLNPKDLSLTNATYKVSVSVLGDSNDISRPLVTDVSDGYFTIDAPVVVGTSSITVLSPNGGETFQAGKPMTVTWKSQGFPSTTKATVYLIKGGKSIILKSAEVTDDVLVSSGQETIPLSAGIMPGVDYTVGVYAGDPSINGNIISDTSNAPFAIFPSAVTLADCPQININGVGYSIDPCYMNTSMTDGQGDKNFTVTIIPTNPQVTYGFNTYGYGEGLPTYGILGGESGAASGSHVFHLHFNDNVLSADGSVARVYGAHLPIKIYNASAGPATAQTLNLDFRLTINPSATPIPCSINSLTANPISIKSGQSSAISWSTTGCNSTGVVLLSPNGSPSIPQTSASNLSTGPLTATTTYTLSASAVPGCVGGYFSSVTGTPCNSVTKNVTVTVPSTSSTLGVVFVPLRSTSAQTIISGPTGAVDAAKFDFNFTSATQTTIWGLTFSVAGPTTVTSMKIGTVTAPVIGGLAKFGGLNLVVPAGTGGLNVDAYASYPAAGTSSVPSPSKSKITLTSMSYISGPSSYGNTLNIPTPEMTLVAGR